MGKHTAIIGLGGNLNDTVQCLKDALVEIGALPGTAVVKASSIYKTQAQGFMDQPDYTNQAAIVETDLEAKELLKALRVIEENHGRLRPFKGAPRTLDLDVIDFDGRIDGDPELTLPHPRSQFRAFVLVPLKEIAPEYRFPDSKLTAGECYAKLDDLDEQKVVKLDV